MFDIVYGKDKTILRVKDTFALLRTGVLMVTNVTLKSVIILLEL